MKVLVGNLKNVNKTNTSKRNTVKQYTFEKYTSEVLVGNLMNVNKRVYKYTTCSMLEICPYYVLKLCIMYNILCPHRNPHHGNGDTGKGNACKTP